jgi:hypothetical protein
MTYEERQAIRDRYATAPFDQTRADILTLLDEVDRWFEAADSEAQVGAYYRNEAKKWFKIALRLQGAVITNQRARAILRNKLNEKIEKEIVQ